MHTELIRTRRAFGKFWNTKFKPPSNLDLNHLLDTKHGLTWDLEEVYGAEAQKRGLKDDGLLQHQDQVSTDDDRLIDYETRPPASMESLRHMQVRIQSWAPWAAQRRRIRF